MSSPSIYSRKHHHHHPYHYHEKSDVDKTLACCLDCISLCPSSTSESKKSTTKETGEKKEYTACEIFGIALVGVLVTAMAVGLFVGFILLCQAWGPPLIMGSNTTGMGLA